MHRTVAFLDVLGFKALIEAVPHQELLARYRTLQAVARQATSIPVFPDDHRRRDSDAYYDDHEIRRARTVHVVMASDSIVVFPEADDYRGTMDVLAAVRALLAAGLKAGLPLRGGVARGELDLLEDPQGDDASDFLGRFDGLVGRGLVDAYRLEGECEWSGATVHPDVADSLHAVALMEADDGVGTAWHLARSALLVVPTTAPVKVTTDDGSVRVEPQRRWAVAWPFAIGEGAAVRELGETGVASAFTSAGVALGRREEAKRDATIAFMRRVKADVESTPLTAPPSLSE